MYQIHNTKEFLKSMSIPDITGVPSHKFLHGAYGIIVR